MKRLVLAALALALIGVSCWLVLAGRKPQPLPPPITLPDGSSVRVLAVTYGTNHVFGSKVGRFVSHLPAALQDFLTGVFGQRAAPAETLTTATPEMIVWLDHQTNRAGVAPPTSAYFVASLADGSNFTSGAEMNINSYLPFSTVEPLHFGIFPRRGPVIHLNIFNHDTTGGVHFWKGVTFSNPAYRTYPQWQAEPLPAVKRTADVEATLVGLETGHGHNSTVAANADGTQEITLDTNPGDGRNETLVKLKLRPLTDSNAVWQVAGVEVSDATGNGTHNSGMSTTGSGRDAGFSFTPGLWPGEAAWKVKLELKRTAGFKPGEMLTFKNVPLGKLDHTNTVAWATNFGGMNITLQNICRRRPLTNDTWSSAQLSTAHFTMSKVPDGTQLDLLEMVCDTGQTNHPMFWSSGGTERDYGFKEIPAEAQTADFTFAVQKSEMVEFTAKPEIPKVTAKH